MGPEKLVQSVRKANEDFIVSASGWRKVFSDGGPESFSPAVGTADSLMAKAVGLALARNMKPGERVLVGTDTRPTGPVLADLVMTVFARCGLEVCYLGISAAPEIMAFSHRGFDRFFYISASHNPVGHNGFKFGSDGGVFDKQRSEDIVKAFRAICASEEDLSGLDSVETLHFEPDRALKAAALECYRDFVLGTVGDLTGLKGKEFGVVIDFNGSARAASIDLLLLDSLGIRHREINARPGEIAHAIVPEAENLEPCRLLLEQAHRQDPSFILGYMPDNDGDRGNLVYIDENSRARILPAQTVFALSVLCSLAVCRPGNLAVAANGPTSGRTDEICAAFGAGCFRAEVGEANAVNLAQKLRDDGMTVPLCGEGSNGGVIMHPSKVRDPADTLLCILRFLSDSAAIKRWTGNGGCTIGQLVSSLPVYTTTDAFSPLAGMRVTTNDFSAFKDLFEQLWEENTSVLKENGIASWVEYQLEGISNRRASGPGGRSGNCRGGLKYELYDAEGSHLGFVWMRPSGTEPLLRLLVDLKGDKAAVHDLLLKHLRSLVALTDRRLAAF